MTRRALAVAALGVALALAGCTASDPLAEEYRDGGDQNYISGDGAVVEIAPDDRGEPVEWTGETPDGTELSSDDHVGEVYVVNFWYAGCPPCRAEADDLEEVAAAVADDDVQLIGVNTTDDAETADAFARTYEVSYPTVLDAGTNSVQLAFVSDVPPNAVPTTLVLDREGRVAGRISGRLEAASILESMIDRVLAEAE
ncbi:thiol-disulfide isomerase/thioredoxin [Diaminobutyricimonas aerilata]|uniref:Thiol-disulfide isomerase/thioredoxin n=1 Tax=Diaminobutyricimonas aerilata TaxID=1162967 RepID=A0A2M9CGC0_9MICO|nr:TlpA disulfide reductase family protein [Diaminobutyricimonas aerilata]PJJ70910.1 thiol-disulfide isomerase/thioredoxin [Diaminobutyricimonas aerilata]